MEPRIVCCCTLAFFILDQLILSPSLDGTKLLDLARVEPVLSVKAILAVRLIVELLHGALSAGLINASDDDVVGSLALVMRLRLQLSRPG